MLRRSVLCGFAALALSSGTTVSAKAAVADPTLGAAAARIASVTDARWVCGPYRCAYVPNYAGPVVVRPYMRGWLPPPRPHCNYVRGPRGRWALVCP